MAEGWARQLIGDQFDICSAGIRAHGLNRVAVQVMSDAGVDISAQRSKTIGALGNLQFDYVVTVCDNAHETCPVFPGKAKRLHHSFDDPPRLAELAQTDDEAMGHYLRVRDEIRDFIGLLPDLLARLT
jgi:arsenate reductase